MKNPSVRWPLNCHPQPDPIVRRVDEILASAKVPLGCLDARMAEKHLDLLQFATGSAAEFCTGTATIVGRDSRDTGNFGIRLEHLPDDLLG